MRIFTIFLLIFFIFIFGCNKDDNSVNQVQNNSGVIMPLKVGNQWTYIDSSFAENGSLISTDSSRLGITGKTNIFYNGQSIEVFYWNWLNINNNQPEDFKWLARNETEGLYMYGGRYLDSNFVFQKTLDTKYPVNVGDTWERITYSFRRIITGDSSFYSFYISDTVLVTCISINQKFITAIGEFECYVYNYQRVISNENDYIYLYYAKDVGYVGYQRKTNGILRRNKTLKSIGLLKSVPKIVSKIVNSNKEHQSAYDIE